jgi:predicted 3-demethylubiquinone-9 3-methyltransferase (glyoxalase superfamily)
MDTVRHFKRVTIDLGAELMLNHRAFQVTVKDISLGGAYIQSSVTLQMNEEIEMRIFLNAVEHVVEVAGRVAWLKGKDGFGIAFQELKPIDVWALMKQTESIPKEAF